MEKVGNMNFYSLDEVKDELIGKIGTPERDEHERKVSEAVNAYYVGEAIKNARIKQNLSQEELGEKIGVKRSQICKLESGKCSPTLSTISRVFQALGITTATLDLGIGGKVALW
jgi:ribosome-binding protein aMBF1 (putative translation factor)